MASIEEKRNIQSAVVMLLLSFGIILFLYFIGIPLIGKLMTFIGNVRNINQIKQDDITPPPPPRFNLIPDHTNNQDFILTGSSESGTNIKLSFNNKEYTNITDKDGNFTFNLKLEEGENILSAQAIDQAGNVGKSTQVFKVDLDNKPPNLEVLKPTDNSSFYGSNQRQLTIQGKTDVDCQININDRFVSVDGDGNFQYTSTLTEGENKFGVKSSDLAGNVTEKILTINFSP